MIWQAFWFRKKYTCFAPGKKAPKDPQNRSEKFAPVLHTGIPEYQSSAVCVQAGEMLRAGESACIQRSDVSRPEASRAREERCAVLYATSVPLCMHGSLFFDGFSGGQSSADPAAAVKRRHIFHADRCKLINYGQSQQTVAVGSSPASSRSCASAAYRFFMENAKSVCAVNAQKTHN